MIRTKMICTIGPACDNDEVMRGLLENGMDCARMNFSHGTHKEQLERLNRFRRIRDELNLTTPVLLDTKGPEIRTGKFKKEISVSAGDIFTIKLGDIIGDETQMSVSYKKLHEDISVGQRILVDDGLVGMTVTAIEDNGDIACIIENGGHISSHKSVNVPGAKIKLPGLTSKDEKDILFAIENDYDFIAVSFVRTANDLVHVRSFLDRNNGSDILVLAKIENQEGVDNIDEIIRLSDGIMVARGDLGVEIPVHQVPIVQKRLIKKCMLEFKIVIIATQMLDSMIRNPRPTRAEASDVANAIFDGASCTMLSGETANGKYPIESLTTMRDIVREAEDSINYWGRLKSSNLIMDFSITDAISMATCTTAMELRAKCIVTFSQSGHTAKAISRLHPQCPVICASPSAKVVRQLQLFWGVFAYEVDLVTDTDMLFEMAIKTAEKSGLVNTGDLLVITAGVPVGMSGTTNIIKVEMIGDVMASGTSLNNHPLVTTGEILKISSTETVDSEDCMDKIIVATKATETLLPALRKAKALLTEQDDAERYALAAALTLDIPVIVSVRGLENLKTGTVVSVEALPNGRGIIKHT